MNYSVTSEGKPDYFESRASIGDVVTYSLDFTPWLEGKGSISSTVWTLHSGNATIADTDQSALITFGSSGKQLISCIVTTSTGEAKKIWLLVKVLDQTLESSDYS